MKSSSLFFLGDICVGKQSIFFPKEVRYFLNKADHIIANLEGAISSESNDMIVNNDIEVLTLLKNLRVDSVNLANNHIFDEPLNFQNTVNLLDKSSLKFFGAGENFFEAKKPLCLECDSSNIFFFSFGWETIGCKCAKKNSLGVNPFEIDHLFKTIKELRSKDKDSIVIFLFHWNFELELYPQPMYRQLCRDLIDEGVDGIIGMHPHVAQGAEVYNGKPIVYSLGNWIFPPRKLSTIELRFPEISNKLLAFELNVSKNQIVDFNFHWFKFSPNELKLTFDCSERIDGEIITGLSPFRGQNDKIYGKWFRKNRRKKLFLPVYYDYHSSLSNRIKDKWVKFRQKIISFLMHIGLKNSPS